jgi:CBS domain-containing protein
MSNKNNIQNSPYAVFEGTPLKKVMEIITHNRRGTVIVVNSKLVVLGVATDGDIRRALIKGASDITPVEKIMNTNFIYARKGNEREEILARNPQVEIVPVLDNSNKITDVIVKE